MELCNSTLQEISQKVDPGCVVVSDYIYLSLALFMFSIFIMGILFNGIFIYILLFHKDLRARNNIYIITLCVASILIGALAVPFVGASAVSHHWLFGTNGCVFHGFIVTWLGLIQICILSVLSMEKYLIIVRRTRDDFLSFKANLTLLCVCIIYSGMLASYPLFGWNEYSLGPLVISCEINLSNTTANYHSYTICLLILGLVVPLGVILFSYINILILVRNRGKNLSTRNKDEKNRKAKEIKIVKTIFLLIAAFIVSWLPYSGLVLITLFYPYMAIHPVLSTLPSLLAKSSIIWNPIIYLVTNTIFKNAFIKSLPCTKLKCDVTFGDKNRCYGHKSKISQLRSHADAIRYKKGSVASTSV